MDSYLRDTLLRMAEHPRLYAPKWSVEILNEVSRNLQAKFRLAPEKVNYLLGVMTDAFPDAMVCGYESLMDSMTCHPKDRHVLAAAVRSCSDVIVTYNRKDFPPQSLDPFDIEVQSPSQFLIHILHIDSESVRRRIGRFAQDRCTSETALLADLERRVPGFVAAYRVQFPALGT
jgi:predicted nucleic acid-binding protein